MQGFEHTRVNLLCTVAIAGGMMLTGREDAAYGISLGMVIGTLWITPDLDLTYNDARRNWGPLRWIWNPYASACRHRGINHMYVIGPIMRLLYLALWFAAPAYFLWTLLTRTGSWPELSVPLPPVTFVLAGYVAAQWLHLLCDGITPFSKTGRSLEKYKVKPKPHIRVKPPSAVAAPPQQR